MFKRSLVSRGPILAGAMAAMLCAPAHAGDYTGAITTIEIWAEGNVAFRLAGVGGTCATNEWFVINKSTEGGKNLYAALLAAKLADKPIRINSSGCGPAEGYGSTPYLQVSYLYIN